jgi:hypothetical protein
LPPMSISRFRTLSSFVAITPSHHDQLLFVPAAPGVGARGSHHTRIRKPLALNPGRSLERPVGACQA